MYAHGNTHALKENAFRKRGTSTIYTLYVYGYVSFLYTHMCVYTYMRMHIYTYTCMQLEAPRRASECIHIHVYMCIHIYVYTQVCVYKNDINPYIYIVSIVTVPRLRKAFSFSGCVLVNAYMQHTATHCDSLQHTAAHCNIWHLLVLCIQHAHCSVVQRVAACCSVLQRVAVYIYIFSRT